MSQTLKIAIPMAGWGTRMRPHTWSKPKPLMALAGKTVLDYVLAQFDTLPDPQNVEFIFIVGPQGDQIKAYMEQRHPDKKAHYVLQAEMRGQSHALYLAREYLSGPMIMAFSDTLIETDLSFLKDEKSDIVAWVKPVPDPRRFGVAKEEANGLVSKVIEKPQDMSNNLALVGFYYFRSSEALIAAIEEQMARKIMLKNEYFLADALNILLEKGARMVTSRIETWLDAGTIEAIIDTNRALLENGRHDNSAEAAQRPGVAVIPPVYIAPDAVVESSVVGPYVSLGSGCVVKQAVVSNSIVEDNAHLEQVVLKDSLIGRQASLHGRSGVYNIGDNSSIL